MRADGCSREAVDRARSALSEAGVIASFSGAGLSAESGIPTFRDAQEGLWAKYDPMDLASPQGFARDPHMVVDWYNWRRTLLAEREPNAAHIALAQRPDMLHITQNVDDLLERAGADAARIVHVHGRISADRCNRPGCGHEEAIDLRTPPGLRACARCGDRMRPAVVWFGEALPSAEWERAAEACMNCDALLVIGTSAAVYPAAGLISIARQSGATIVIINTEPSEASHLAQVEIIAPAGEVVPHILSI